MAKNKQGKVTSSKTDAMQDVALRQGVAQTANNSPLKGDYKPIPKFKSNCYKC